ncbi:hypothetical protein [Streptomyces sp. NPDC085529]|uniref:hypothetical protein n=1 Tax=Streptomyces sp. NPDC085529 TaxID=3365729 RepID=UPI0037D88041
MAWEEWEQLKAEAVGQQPAAIELGGAIDHDINTETKHPEVGLDRAGRTIGFLEEARYQATNDKKHVDLTDASWEKAWAHHLVGGALTRWHPTGDAVQRGVDLVASAWPQDK